MEKPIRCKACNGQLSSEDLKRKAFDWDFCSECRFQSSRQFCASDRDYEHGQLTSITLDGRTLTIDLSWLDDENE